MSSVHAGQRSVQKAVCMPWQRETKQATGNFLADVAINVDPQSATDLVLAMCKVTTLALCCVLLSMQNLLHVHCRQIKLTKQAHLCQPKLFMVGRPSRLPHPQEPQAK